MKTACSSSFHSCLSLLSQAKQQISVPLCDMVLTRWGGSVQRSVFIGISLVGEKHGRYLWQLRHIRLLCFADLWSKSSEEVFLSIIIMTVWAKLIKRCTLGAKFCPSFVYWLSVVGLVWTPRLCVKFGASCYRHDLGIILCSSVEAIPFQ